MEKIRIRCECSWCGNLIDYKSHYLTDHQLKCQYCNLNFKSINQLENNLNDSCILKSDKFPYEKLGCDIKKSLNIIEHLNTQVPLHLNMVNNNLHLRIESLEKQLQEIKSKISLNINKSSILLAENQNSASHNSLSINIKYQSLSTKLLYYEADQKLLKEDLIKMIISYEKLNHEVENYKKTLMKSWEDLENFKKSFIFSQATIRLLEERLLAQEQVTYEGFILWKISYVAEKFQNALSGKQLSISSNFFYTSKQGYKLCAKAYLNGDGAGRSTHLSIFIVIMKGEYDNLLKWPFKQKITFILLDQMSKENVNDSFLPDPNSSSFKKPTSEMNIANGIPLFCPLSKLHSTEHEYIKDDCMFIKIIADSRDLFEV